MIIYYNNGATPVTADILPSFSPGYSPAFNIGETTDGGWFIVDRGIAYDMYTTEITFTGPAASIFALHDKLIGSEMSSAIRIVPETNEYIFGPHVPIGVVGVVLINYDCVITGHTGLEQQTLTTWSFGINVMLAEQPVITAATFPATLYPKFGVSIDADNGNGTVAFYKMTNGGAASYQTDRDRATCRFVVSVDSSTASDIMSAHAASLRGLPIDQFSAPTLAGVPEPFGSSHTYPCAVRILEVSGLVQYAPNRWEMEILMGRDV